MADSLPEGMEVDSNDRKEWRWNYQSPGGSFYLAPKPYKTRAAAVKAAIEWHKEFTGS